MRYENINPQQAYLLEKIEELENQLRLKEDMGKLAGKYLDKHLDLQMKMI